METKFTKGEWGYMTVGNVNGFYKKVFSGVTSICNVTTRNIKEAESNAKLISAAPDLLEALVELVDDYNFEKGNSFYNSIIEKAKQAIKKATE